LTADLFGDRSDRLLRVEIGGRHVELGLPGTPRTVTPTAAGSTVTYASAVDGADLQYAVMPRGKDVRWRRKYPRSRSVQWRVEPCRRPATGVEPHVS
jgi:hypothetical protein